MQSIQPLRIFKNLISIFLTLGLCVSPLTACNSEEKESMPMASEKINSEESACESEEIVTQAKKAVDFSSIIQDPELDVYKEVFEGKTKFIDILSGNAYLVSEYDLANAYDESTDEVNWYQYCKIDLDGDECKELIIEVGEPLAGYYIILHEHNGNIYSYRQYYRSMTNIYENTFISASGGADINRTYSIYFAGTEMVQYIICEQSGDDYFIEGKKVEVDEYYDYLSGYLEANEISWVTLEE